MVGTGWGVYGGDGWVLGARPGPRDFVDPQVHREGGRSDQALGGGRIQAL